MSDSCAVESAV